MENVIIVITPSLLHYVGRTSGLHKVEYLVVEYKLKELCKIVGRFEK